MNGHKRDDSLIPVKENCSLPQKCDDTNEPHFGGGNILSDKMHEDIRSGVVGNTMTYVPGCSAKVKINFMLVWIL